MPSVRLTTVLCVGLMTSSCIWTSQRVAVQAVDPQATAITSPVKAHLDDGTTVVYPNGVRVVGEKLQGTGIRYDLTLERSGTVDSIPLASVVAMESFSTETNVGQSILVSTLATTGAVVGAAALAVALFGSCPTVYSSDGQVEEAELFSSSIAPLFEARDVDRLSAQPDADGTLTLEVRNEAMETHYINHLQVLEVAHEASEAVLPDQQGRPLVVSGIRAPDSVTDSHGNDIREVLVVADDQPYSSDMTRIENATVPDMNDWIDVRAAIPQGLSEVGVVLRLRNSLLSTVLLYNWIRNNPTAATFEPTDTVLLDALRKWGGMRQEFEERFRNDRVPVQ